ncbi:MAG: VOC family protein [Dehalococcoidia bacterium]|nr:VOC family protein [Dehalococcoidia bacterium]
MASALAVRYIVDDVDAAVAFYTERLGFTLVQQMGAPFALLERDGLRLWLAGPGSSARRPMPDGALPAPGGWNRPALEVEDLPAVVASWRDAGVRFRNEPLSGPGGRQVVAEDPSGNPIELFEPAPR